MKKHNGMRPHDIVVLLKIAAKGSAPWMMKDLASELGISPSEISESLHRSVFAGLLSPDKRRVMKAALLEFLQFGMKYVYPQQPGGMVRGMATAHSAPPLVDQIDSKEKLVWPFSEGKDRGHALEPLYSGAAKASQKDPKLYELLALTDTLRVGRVREKNIALTKLKATLNEERMDQ